LLWQNRRVAFCGFSEVDAALSGPAHPKMPLRVSLKYTQVMIWLVRNTGEQSISAAETLLHNGSLKAHQKF
jgi:hypothetical protein